eukprot:356995-Chlamydomonas_euryale.AAC.22
MEPADKRMGSQVYCRRNQGSDPAGHCLWRLDHASAPWAPSPGHSRADQSTHPHAPCAQRGLQQCWPLLAAPAARPRSHAAGMCCQAPRRHCPARRPARSMAHADIGPEWKTARAPIGGCSFRLGPWRCQWPPATPCTATDPAHSSLCGTHWSIHAMRPHPPSPPPMRRRASDGIDVVHRLFGFPAWLLCGRRGNASALQALLACQAGPSSPCPPRRSLPNLTYARTRPPCLTCILPHHRVDRHVRVHQVVVEPRRAVQPVHVEVLCQQARSRHAHALLHPAGATQLAHAGVDEREAGCAALPRAECRGGALAVGPCHAGVCLADRLRMHGGPVVELPVCQLAPHQAACKRFGQGLGAAGKAAEAVLALGRHRPG